MRREFNLSGKSVILWGGTGQSKVVRPIIESRGGRVIAIFDDTPNLKAPFDDVPLYFGWDGFLEWKKSPNYSATLFAVTIGNPHGHIRQNLHQKLVDAGLQPACIVDRTAIIASNARLGQGIQILAGVIVQPEAIIGDEVILNTKASVDHECRLANGVELAPGATLCGCVTAEENSWICAGATVLPRINIGKGSIVGAGAVVRQHVDPYTIVAGVPARKIRSIEEKF